MEQQNLVEVGDVADTLDNLLCAMQLPVPLMLHFQAIQESLPRLRDKLRAVYVSESGENPWSGA